MGLSYPGKSKPSYSGRIRIIEASSTYRVLNPALLLDSLLQRESLQTSYRPHKKKINDQSIYIFNFSFVKFIVGHYG